MARIFTSHFYWRRVTTLHKLRIGFHIGLQSANLVPRAKKPIENIHLQNGKPLDPDKTFVRRLQEGEFAVPPGRAADFVAALTPSWVGLPRGDTSWDDTPSP